MFHLKNTLSDIDRILIVQALDFVLVIVPFGIWFAILSGGHRRWSGATFEVAHSFPGAPYSWALLLLIGTMLLAVGSVLPTHETHHQARGKLIFLGALINCVWSLLFATSVLISMTNPLAGNLHPLLWIGLSSLYAVRAAAQIEREEKE